MGLTRGPRMDAGPLDAGTSVEPAYEAANGTGKRSAVWRVASWGPNTAVTWALQDLRDRSRDMVRKNAFARSAVNKLVSNMIGKGIRPQSQCADPGFQKAFNALWSAWVEEADSVGTLDFYGLQAMAARGMVEGGETFTRLRVRFSSDGLPVPLQLQVMEGDQCNHLYGDGINIRNGIEYDPIGARAAYWMYNVHPGDGFQGWKNDPFGLSRIPAEQIAHLHRGGRPGQARGEPWLGPALTMIYTLGKYLDAELVRKQTAALFLGFVKKVADGINPMASDDPDADGSANLTMEPGTLQILEEGEDVTFAQPTDVGANFEIFMRECKRAIAIATDNLYELLSGDMSQLNDRTMRAAFNDFKRQIEAYQTHLIIFQWCRPVFNKWMDLALLTGALKLPRGMAVAEAYKVKWVPDGWAYIHPVQDVEGKILEIQGGLSTRSHQVSETGLTSEDVDKENAADNARADELKLVYSSDGRQKAVASPAPVQGAKQDA